MSRLDLLGPQTVRCKFTDIYLVWKTLTLAQTDTNISINPNCTFIDCPNNLDIIFPPVGLAAVEMIQDEAVLSFIREKSLTRQYITVLGTDAANAIMVFLEYSLPHLVHPVRQIKQAIKSSSYFSLKSLQSKKK
jgi:hypothetical protein